MTANVRSYRDLEAWRAAMDVADVAYEVTSMFPSDERFGLSQQMRRAAVSIPANVAEGHARRSLRAYVNHLGIALGSLAELDTELEVAERRGYVNAPASQQLRGNIDRSRRIIPDSAYLKPASRYTDSTPQCPSSPI